MYNIPYNNLTSDSLIPTSNTECTFDENEIYNSNLEYGDLSFHTDGGSAIQTNKSEENSLFCFEESRINLNPRNQNNQDDSFYVKNDSVSEIYDNTQIFPSLFPDNLFTNNLQTFNLIASQSRSERKKVIDSLLEILKNSKNTNLTIHIQKNDFEADNMIYIQKLKRRENNEKNIHRNFIKTIGRNIIRFIKNKNNKVLINHFLSKNSTNYENFKNWMKNQNLYEKFVTINSFKKYLLKKNEGMKYDKNMLIFREIGKYYLKNESIYEIISKKMRSDIMELYLKCSVSLINGLKNPDNFNSIKNFLPQRLNHK